MPAALQGRDVPWSPPNTQLAVSVSFEQTDKNAIDKYPLWSWDGDATVTKSGNTYKITGNIRPRPVERTGPPAPFQFDDLPVAARIDRLRMSDRVGCSHHGAQLVSE